MKYVPYEIILRESRISEIIRLSIAEQLDESYLDNMFTIRLDMFITWAFMLLVKIIY